MIMIEQKTNYVASLIRKHMRMNVSKKDEFIYRLAKIAKECSTYGEWGTDLVFDKKNDHWATSSKIDMFNTACQIGVNMLGTLKGKKVETSLLKNVVEIIYKLGVNEDSFSMPKTKDVIQAIKDNMD